MEITIIVDGQKLSMRSESAIVAPGSQEFVKFLFTISDDWKGLSLSAKFVQGANVYTEMLDDDNGVYLPDDIVQGYFLLSLYGVSGKKIATTNGLRLFASDNGFVSDADSIEVSQSLYQQLVNMVQDNDIYESPVFKGVATVPTPEVNDDSLQIANTEFVNNAISNNIANNLTTETSGYSLDARQGKVLKDLIKSQIDLEVANNLTIENSGYVLDARQGMVLNNTKADIDSPILTGVPQAPTATAGTSSTQIANTEFVNTAIDNTIINNTTTEVEGYALDARQGKILNDLINNKIESSAISNNLLIENDGYVLDARQGKVLNDSKANIDSPTFTGTPQAPTAITGTISTQIATTEFVNTAINNKIANNLTTETDGYVLDARQGKILNDLINSQTELEVANNLTTENEGYALDARQGKILNDLIRSQINIEVANNLTTQNEGYVLDARQGNILNNSKANIESPIFTGTPQAPTATTGTSSTQIATTEFVNTAINNNIINNITTETDGYTLDASQGKVLSDLIDTKVNISAIANNLTTENEGYVLDARQGKVLNNLIETKVNISSIANNITTENEGYVLDARQGKVLNNLIETKINASDIANNITTEDEGYVLDARQGKVLNNLIESKINASDIANNLTTENEGYVLDARQGKELNNIKADIDSPTFTGTPQAPTAILGDTSTQIANTEFVNNAIAESISGITAESIAEAISGKADIASPILTGTPQAPTATAGTSSTQIATTEFVNTAINNNIINNITTETDGYALDASQGKVLNDLIHTKVNISAIANNITTEDEGYVLDARQGKVLNNLKANINSPIFTGTPQAPTATTGTISTQIATTEFVDNSINENNISINNTINDILGDFANIESSLVASKDYAVGDYLVYNAKLYKTISEIVSGDNLVIDTNIELTTVGEEIVSKKVANNLTTEDDGYTLDARQGKILNDNKINVSNIANNLTTEDEGYVLDARQGKILNDLINSGTDLNIANNLTTENEGYVLDARQGKILNDSKINTSAIANNLTTTAGGYVLDARQGKALNTAISGKANTSHTHNYAGSSSAGGAATSANKLNTNAGSATQPVYFSGGVPVKTTYTLGKSVPSNAVFTDHTYSAATTSAAGLMSAADKTKLDGIGTGANRIGLYKGTLEITTTLYGYYNQTITFTVPSGGTALAFIPLGVAYGNAYFYQCYAYDIDLSKKTAKFHCQSTSSGEKASNGTLNYYVIYKY